MQGYGYSVWAVPVYYKNIKERYGMKHIPHVTLSTNHLNVPTPLNYGQKLEIEFKHRNMYRLPKTMYEYDPIDTVSAGFYCKIKGYDSPLLHMTLFYDFSGNYSELKAPIDNLEAIVYRADTRSLDPSEWTFF